MSENKPLVSIISVNYNEPEETIEFLESVYQSDYPNFETIIVDNGSKRKIDDKLSEKYPNLKTLIHDKNLGFAGGNNLGIRIANGDYLVFLNNDTLIPKDFISKMVLFIQENPMVGIASPKVVFPNKIIQYAGTVKIHPLTGRGKRIGLMEVDQGQYNKINETDLPHGAAMIVPKKIIKEVGEMPEDYFLYYEEHDWCTRIINAGYKMYYFGHTSVIHKESISVGQDSPLKVYYLNRNRILYHLRNHRGLPQISGLIFYCIMAFPKQLISFLIKGQKEHRKNLVRAVLWHINKKYVYKS